MARKKARVTARKRSSRPARAGLEFNHAMIYTAVLPQAIEFYRDRLGFQVVDSYPGAYLRMKSPTGNSTIALHVVSRGQKMSPPAEGMRLYFEVKDLNGLCRKLRARGVTLDQGPRTMPWGWRHAYLRDPDGHQISLYWAGKARLRATRIP